MANAAYPTFTYTWLECVSPFMSTTSAYTVYVNTGRVWGDVTAVAFSTEEGAFLRGQIKMEEQLEQTDLDQERKSSESE